MDQNSAKYTLELFPVNDEVHNMYVRNLHTLYNHSSREKDGSYVFSLPDDNAGVDLWTVRPQHMDGVTLLDLGVKARMSRVHTIRYQVLTNEQSSVLVHYWLAPRSSIWKHGITQANSIGIIDKTYRGNLMGAVHLMDKTESKIIPEESRLFQILAPDMGYISKIIVQPLSALDETSRGTGGFGSTG